MNWQNELRSALKTSREASSFFGKDFYHLENYPTFIPLKFARHMKEKKSFALYNQFLPSVKEKNELGFVDPIGDSINSQPGGIIHRYDNRILFSPTTKCPINCRYCFRKNELHEQSDLFKSSLNELVKYLESNRGIEEVILTGGDPFFISNNKMKNIIDSLNKIKSIKFIRFHTRFPIIIPSRFDDKLLEILQNSNKKVIIAIHCNHSDEFTEDNKELIKRISKLNFTLLSQTVLLKSVNDHEDILINLFNDFCDLGIRPYYLHHPDEVKGAMHFFMSLEEGRSIYSKIRKRLSGWLIPHYVIDNNLGRGKQFAFNPEQLSFSGQLLDMTNETIHFSSLSPLI